MFWVIHCAPVQLLRISALAGLLFGHGEANGGNVDRHLNVSIMFTFFGTVASCRSGRRLQPEDQVDVTGRNARSGFAIVVCDFAQVKENFIDPGTAWQNW